MSKQNCLIWVFLGWISEKLLYCGALNEHPHIFPNTKFHPKIKILKFGTEIALITFFGPGFQIINVVFEISIFKFVNMQSFIQKRKTLNLRPKILYLDIFGQQFNNNCCQVLNQHRRICETTKLHLERKKVS